MGWQDWKIKNKLLFGFSSIVILVVVSGWTGISMVGKVAENAYVVIEEKMPLIDVSMESIIVLEHTISLSRDFLLNTDPGKLQEIAGSLREGVGDLNMFLSMARFGTESEEFKSSAAGEMYVKDGMDLIVLKPDADAEKIADSALSAFENFEGAVEFLISAHEQRAGYHFDYAGTSYDIKSFFYYLSNRQAKWIAALEDAAKFGSEFKEADASQSEFANWYSNFSTSDKRLGKMLKKYAKLEAKAYKLAKKINGATAQKKMFHFDRAKGRVFNRVAKQQQKIIDYVSPLYDEFSWQELDASAMMQESAEEMSHLLETLEEEVAGEVEEARLLLHETDENAFKLLVGVIVAALFVAALFGVLITGMITRPVIALANVMERIREEGDFSIRAERSSRDEVGQMSVAFNEMLEDVSNSIDEANGVVDAIAHGNFERRVEAELMGDLKRLKDGVNNSAKSIDYTMGEIARVINAMVEGNFSMQVSAEGVEGEYLKMLQQSTAVMNAMEGSISDILQVMNHMQQGEFQQRVEADARGDLLKLKDGINRSLTVLEKALSEVSGVAGQMGEGDLTQQVSGDYSGQIGKLKDAINAMQRNLARIVCKVRESSHKIKTGSTEVSRGSQDLSHRTSEQAASMEQMAASMEEMSGTVSMNAESAGRASQLAAEALSKAREGDEVVTKAIESMEGINASSDRISEIITMIDGLAFQTNLLALNAAVEAARAGDHGRGFAVVAGEVRALAQRSADAASDIRGLIEESSARITEGSELVRGSGDALGAIQSSVKKVNDIAAEITLAAKEQTQGIDQVNNTIAQIDTVTQENAALVEETTATGSELDSQADSLGEVVSLFKLSQNRQKRIVDTASVRAEFVKARSDHLAWKGKIRGYLQGTIRMDRNKMESHNHCVLDQWLDREGRKKYGHLAEMKAFGVLLERFHTLIGDIFALKSQGDLQRAEERSGEVDALSEEIIEMLNRIELKITDEADADEMVSCT